jgi:hypothetical protein
MTLVSSGVRTRPSINTLNCRTGVIAGGRRVGCSTGENLTRI